MPSLKRALCVSAVRAAILVGTLVGCTDATGPARAMAVAQQRWASHGLSAYRVVITRACECLPAMSGPVVVEVRGGSVAARQYVATGEAVAAEFAELFPAVPGLFERVADARRRGAAHVDVTYDPVYGYPARIAVDYEATLADDEILYTASDLQPL